MPKVPGHVTHEHWFAELERKQLAVQKAVRDRDDCARKALEHGLGVRGVAKALRIDKTTAQRRYGRRSPS